jgi:hypothetical protein
MSIKTNLQNAGRKTLETIDKGLQWGQRHPVAVERTFLIVTTVFMTRAAVKRFAPTATIDVKLNGIPKIFGGKPFSILESVSPAPVSYNHVHSLTLLQLNDYDIKDLTFGTGMIFNIQDKVATGQENFPIAVVNYGRLRQLLEDTGLDTNAVADRLLESQPIMDEYFGAKKS